MLRIIVVSLPVTRVSEVDVGASHEPLRPYEKHGVWAGVLLHDVRLYALRYELRVLGEHDACYGVQRG